MSGTGDMGDKGDRDEMKDERRAPDSGPAEVSGLGGRGDRGGRGDLGGLGGLGRLSAVDGDAEPGGLGADELALRRMLHQAVEEIEPADAALEKLRHAVPARRARKRQALVGAAAVVLLVGTAVPALVHVARSGGDSDARPSIAGAESHRHDHEGPSKGKDGKGATGKGKKDDKSKDKKDKEDKGKDKKDKGKGGKEEGHKGGASAGTGSSEPDTDAASSPACAATQLDASGSAGPAEAGGKVYGTFRVVNTSGSSCTVDSAGAVAVTAQGAADPAAINVVDHTAGDGSGLPDPATEPSSLVLKPGAAYEVRFAWVPAGECPADGGGDPSPNPSPTEGTTAGGGSGSEGGDTGGVSTQLVREDGVEDGSVAVSLTAEPGAPSAGATVPNACAGTVYRTGVLPTQ
ncbi:hypothetical protein [Streptomyces sp. NPDC059063]|uniref:hypothetical protein n=1 Tax=unclassified Streptomyces TaxID=2593676 RepID=UPI003693BE8E